MLAAPETAVLVRLRPLTVALVIAAFAAAAFYFPWRLSTFNPNALALSWLVYAAELFGFLTLTLHLFMTGRVTKRTAPAPLKDVTVDLFVTTYNEPVSLVRKTLAAAKAVRGATRVVLLDDGARKEMEALCAELGVAYFARETNTHAKAGNLNNGLANSTADFVATFDADHAPAPNFMEATLGYFADARVAFVQTPQDFYNLDSIQHRGKAGSSRIWTEQSLFFRVIQPGKDRWNAAFFCGSCAVLRRSALDAIGGFATGTIAEDLHTSVKLHKAKFASVYHAETLAFGVSPQTYEPYEVQRVRWGQGAMQVWRKEGVLFARGFTLAQRISYLASIITYFDGWQKAIFYALPPFVLITGIMPIVRIDWEFALRFLPWFTLSLVLGEELGRGYGRTLHIEQYNFLRFPAFLKSTFALVWPQGMRFRVTRKNALGLDGSGRQLSRLALVPALSLAAIPFGFARYFSEGHMPVGALISNTVWALLTSAIAVSALMFAARCSRERRGDYRFLAPLPVDVHLPSGGWGALRAVDVNTTGMRLAAPMGLDLAVGAKLDAQVRLPSGVTPLKLRIRHRKLIEAQGALPQRVEIGCTATWADAKASDALAAHLYGSGIDQRLREMNERAPTFLGTRGEGADVAADADLPRVWAPGLAGEGDGAVDVAAQPISADGVTWRVFSFAPLTDEALMRLPARSGEAAAHLKIIDTQAIPAGAGSFHVSRVSLDLKPLPAREGKTQPWRAGVAAASAVAVLLIGALFLAPHARAETLALTGVEAGPHSSYAYAGAVVPLPGARVGDGWAARLWADRLTYDYETNGTRVEADAAGGEAALVRQWSGAWGYSNASAGVRYRDTSLTPDDFFNRTRGARWDAALQLDGRATIIQHYAILWLATHQIDQQSSFVRLGFDRQMGQSRLGLDVTRGWDRSYGQTQAGMIASWDSGRGWSVGVRAGAQRNDDRGDTGAYLGLNLSFTLR